MIFASFSYFFGGGEYFSLLRWWTEASASGPRRKAGRVSRPHHAPTRQRSERRGYSQQKVRLCRRWPLRGQALYMTAFSFLLLSFDGYIQENMPNGGVCAKNVILFAYRDGINSLFSSIFWKFLGFPDIFRICQYFTLLRVKCQYKYAISVGVLGLFARFSILTAGCRNMP